ncbi:MAG: hypothetical protein ABG776_06630 [Cyanobacteria bacterium J06555_13]
MVKAKETPKIAVRRTDDIEGLLRSLWMLRPELEEHHKLTLILGIEALIRDHRLTANCMSSLGPTPTPQHSVVVKDSSTALGGDDSSVGAESDVSDDVEWG